MVFKINGKSYVNKNKINVYGRGLGGEGGLFININDLTMEP